MVAAFLQAINALQKKPEQVNRMKWVALWRGGKRCREEIPHKQNLVEEKNQCGHRRDHLSI